MFGNYKYEDGLCPVAEDLQKSLLLFKTNYWDTSCAEQQATVLANTICSFNKG